MVDQRLPHRVSGPVRILGLLALLLGIAAMHAGVGALQQDAHAATPAHSAVMAQPTDGGQFAAAGTGDHQAVTHTAGRACVFILSALALAVGLVLLYRFGIESDDLRIAALRHWRVHRGHPPPWTAPTLAELSILRI